MKRRTRREDGRGEKRSSVEFEHLLDAVRRSGLPPPTAPGPDPATDGSLPVEQLDEQIVDPPAVPGSTPASSVAEVSINDDLLPAPRRRRWGRR